MIKEIDAIRFNFCLKIARKFYILSRVLLQYAKNIGVVGDASLNVRPCDLSSDDITFSSFDFHESFNPYSYESDENESYSNILIRQIFNIYKGHIFINFYEKIDLMEFKSKFKNDYSEEVLAIIYAASKCIVPLEINVNSFQIKCSHGDLSNLMWSRRPLIDTMYRSNEIIDFIDKMNSILLFSTILYNSLYEKSLFKSGDYDPYNFWEFYKTWDSNIFDLKRCFSYYGS